MAWKRWHPNEVAEALRLYRAGWSYKRIGERLGRNHSSVGYVVRREDLREEARMVAEETRKENESHA